MLDCWKEVRAGAHKREAQLSNEWLVSGIILCNGSQLDTFPTFQHVDILFEWMDCHFYV
jgi:hypothetical protein